MATVDNLDIQISSSAKSASTSIDKLIGKLGKLSSALKIDTSSLSNIGKNIDFNSITKGMDNVQNKMKDVSKPIETQMKKVSKSLDKIYEQYKDLGKGFEFKGSTAEIQRQIDKYSNSLEKARLKKQELEASGKTEGQRYENAVKDVIKYSNILDSLQKQILSIENKKTKIGFDISKFGQTKKTIDDFKRILSEFDEMIENRKETNIELKIPIRGLEMSVEQLRKLYPEAEELIVSFEAEIERAKGLSINVPTIQYEGIDLSVFEQIGSKTKEISERITEFRNKLTETIVIPPIQEENLNKLQNSLVKTESKLEELKVKLANGISVGRISENIDDSGFRKLQEQIVYTEKQAEALRDKIAEVQNQSGKTAQFGKISQALNSVGSAFLKISQRSKVLTGSLGKVQNSFKSLLRSILPILGIRQLFNWGKQAIDISSDLTEVQNVVDVTFGNMTNKIEDFSETSIVDFGMSELTAKQISSRFQAMGTAIGFSQNKMSDMSIELTKLAADMASFYNVEQEDVAKSLESVFTGTTRPLRQYGIDLTQTTLQEWAMKKGLDANIQSMSQAEKTMLRYQYVLEHTGAAQGDFARTSDTWANQTRILTQNMERLASVIGGNLTRALKPLVKALNVAMNYIISFAETVSSALGKIFGWKYEVGGGGLAQDFEDASGYAEDLADSTGQTAKNIKKMQAGLRTFDELKVINMSEDTDGAGGGAGLSAGGIGGYGAETGEWVKESGLLDFESELNTLYKLGNYINKTLIDAMDSIDWNFVYEKARNFGKGLADFLNGLISPELFGSVGKTIANSLNTAIYPALSFGETFDFKEFGLSIAKGINDFFYNFDFDSLSKTINVWADGIWTVIKTALFGDEGEGGIDFEGISKRIREFFSDLEGPAKTFLAIFSAPIIVAGIGGIITNVLGLTEAFTGLSALFAEGGAFAGISSLFAEGGIFAGISAGPIAAVVAIIAALTAAIIDAWNTSEEFRDAISDYFETIKEKLSNAFETIKEKLEPLGESIQELGENFYSFYQNSGLQDLVAQFLTWDTELKTLGISVVIDLITEALSFMITQLTGVIDMLSGLFEILDGIVTLDFDKVLSGFGTFGEGLFEAILGQTPDEFVENMMQSIEPLVEWFNSDVVEPVSDFFEKLKENIKNIWEDITDWFNENVIEKISNFFIGLSERISLIWNSISEWLGKNVIEPIVGFFVGLATRVQQVFEGLWIIIQAIWKVVSEWFNDNIIQPVGKLFSSLWEGIKVVWSVVSSWFNENVIIPVSNFFDELWKNVSGFFSQLWEDIKTVWHTVSTWFNETVIIPVSDFFRGLWEDVIGFFSNLWEDIKDVWGKVYEWFDSTIIEPVSGAFSLACDAISGFFSKLWSGIKTGVGTAMNVVISTIESAINWIVKGINGIISGFNTIVTVSAKIVGANWSGVSQLSRVSLGRISVSGYATGGFPEDGWFRASHGEIMGKFDNGQSVVANNKQITEGISDAVQKGNQENNMLMRQEIELLKSQNNILIGILEKEFGITEQQIGRAAQNYSRSYMARTGNPAYDF